MRRWHLGSFKTLLADALLIVLAWWLAFWLRFNFDVAEADVRLAWLTTPLAVLGMLAGLSLARVHRHAWRYVSLADLRRLAAGVAAGAVLTTALVMIGRLEGFARSVFPISALLALVLLAGARAAWRSLGEGRLAGQQAAPGRQPLLVAGTLQEADQALRTLKGAAHWQVAGIVSPRPEDAGRTVQGVPVLGTTTVLDQIAHVQQIGTVLVASPAGSGLRRELLMRWSGAGLSLLTLPAADEWLAAEGPNLRKVELADLLGREPVQLDEQGLHQLFAGRTVLVTGAGGSIGAELCRQAARFGAGRLVCLDVSEFAIYQLEQELAAAFPALQAEYLTANVRESARIEALMQACRPAVVLHAAAYKHVPLMEGANAIEALRTNVLGTLHVARAAGRAGAARFVLVSTDKAVNPTNVMGASKRLAEQVVQAVAAAFGDTQFVSVRFGNVLGSSGSVVPLFTAQIAQGGPVTVTHPDIVRYFMTIPEAAQLVLQAGLMGRSGQIYVLDMGEPVKIAELARMMIRLSGKPESEVPIVFTGLRPGEKLYEELLADGETTDATPHPKLRVARTTGAPEDGAAVAQAWIEAAGAAPDAAAVRAWLQSRVPEYRPRSADS